MIVSIFMFLSRPCVAAIYILGRAQFLFPLRFQDSNNVKYCKRHTLVIYLFHAYLFNHAISM